MAIMNNNWFTNYFNGPVACLRRILETSTITEKSGNRADEE
jgi:hypothetical protein